VVREGKRKSLDTVMEEAEDDRLEREDLGSWDGQYHLSVFADCLLPGETLENAVSRLFGQYRKVKWFRSAQVETLQAAGFDLSASEPDPYHYDVLLGENLTKEAVEAFEGCFEQEARRNPAWRG
jgi:hypothetical protein